MDEGDDVIRTKLCVSVLPPTQTSNIVNIDIYIAMM